MKKCIVVLMLVASTFVLAQTSDDTASREDVLRFLDAMQIQKQMETMQQTMYQQWDAQLDPMLDRMLETNHKQITPEQRSRLKDMIRQSVGEARQRYPVSEMIQDVVPVYQKYLTKSEINAIVQFYTSPVGKELLAKNSIMTREAMAVMMPKIQESIASSTMRMRERMQQMGMEQQQKRGDLPSSLSGPNTN
jgi:hypothetical protein